MRTQDQITSRVEELKSTIDERRVRQHELVLEERFESALGMEDGIKRLLVELRILNWVLEIKNI